MWEQYLKKQEKRKPRGTLVRAVSFCKNKKFALDLGSGNFIESKFLAKKGFKVVAIDHALEAKKYAKKLHKNIKFLNISFKEYDYPKKTFDLVTSQYSLHLYGHKGFNSFIKKIKNTLKPGGVFVGQFFGVRDDWNLGKVPFPAYDYVFHTKKQALGLLSDMKIFEFIEYEEDGKTDLGKLKHWHQFYFIAQKK